MTITDDNVTLTGDRVITIDIKGNFIAKYITFTASSVSENSELDVSTDINSDFWNVQVDIVRCVNDPEGKTFAIRVICPYYYVLKNDVNVRTVRIDGTIYTNNPNIYSNVHEEITIIGCKRSRIPYPYGPYGGYGSGTYTLSRLGVIIGVGVWGD